MNSKRDLPSGSGTGNYKRQKKKQDSKSSRGVGRRRGGVDRYSLREFRDPRVGHLHFLKDCLFNPLLALPPEYRPDFTEDPHNPVVGFRLNNTSRLAIPITALDTARESILKYHNTPLQPFNYGHFTPGSQTFPFPSGYGTIPPFSGYGTGMAPAPPVSETDLVKRIIQQREEAAKKLDERAINEVEELRKGDLKLAQEALKLYNATHDTCYEVVATLGSCHHLDLGHWLHCNFRARDSKRRYSQSKLFFSELFCPGANMLTAKVCTMLSCSRECPQKVLGCKICGDQLWHPISGFERGM